MKQLKTIIRIREWERKTTHFSSENEVDVSKIDFICRKLNCKAGRSSAYNYFAISALSNDHLLIRLENLGFKGVEIK